MVRGGLVSVVVSDFDSTRPMAEPVSEFMRLIRRRQELLMTPLDFPDRR